MPHYLLAEYEPSRVIIASLMLIGVMVGGAAFVMWFRRRMQQEDQPVALGFTLSDLRQLVKEGQMTQEEYEKARAKIIEHSRKQMDEDSDDEEEPTK